MEKFISCRPEDWRVNPFTAIGQQSMLITAVKADGTFNPMTASWGGVGTLWGRDVCTLYIRPQRHTFAFSEGGTKMSLCFFGDAHKDVLRICGTKSGRDIDKVKTCGLTPVKTREGYVYFAEATDVLLVKKLYAQDIEEGCFIDVDMLKWYDKKDYHRMYICEIEDVLVKKLDR